eukprot:CAMPEP_0116545510 /NCGR_PEP_ID=MMETSP0397-20121206/2710_1 /TAXON_ID=216820 /ORGANISM="Cyclophora tenuis, Strain ECT3854" /LENGTH=134 /DNA_ID=CAMNT_0004069835 /DNA_START=134 /DNA_END=538 /DNA_ORIENTATION=-
MPDAIVIPFYYTLLTYEWTCHMWALWFLLYGTPYFSLLLKLLGAQVEGELLYFGSVLQDPYSITFADKTIVDESAVTGHHQVFSTLTRSATKVGGVLHRGTRALGGSNLVDGGGSLAQEYGPFRFVTAPAKLEV